VCVGLEDQLLVDVIKNERPDLEDKKDALVVSIASDQKALKVRLSLTHSMC
jgi:dynein heavy chain